MMIFHKTFLKLKNSIVSFVGCLGISLIAASCYTNGRLAEPINLPSAAIEEGVEDTKNDPLFDSKDWIPPDWWTLFNDDQLTEFIYLAFERNPTLQSTQTNILLAASDANRIRAALFPTLNFAGDVARQKISETGVIPFGTTGSAVTTQIPVPPPPSSTGATAGSGLQIPIYFTLFETELTLSYNFDLWGKNRNMFRGALSDVQAKIADEAFSRLQLGISVAQVYYQLQIDYKRQEIAQAVVNNRTEYLNLTRQRIKENLDTAIAEQSALAGLAGTEQILLQIQGDIAVKEHQLKAYLAGDFLETINAVEIDQKPLPVIPLPQSLPLHLIAQRPDITAQIWVIESAGRQIDVAKAGFYPDFNLNALFGYQTIHLHELFLWKSSYFNIDPAFTLPIFDGGRLDANLRTSEVNYNLAILRYNELVLNAAKEVLDGISVLQNAEQQYKTYKQNAEAQDEIFKLTAQRVEHNLDSGLNYLISEGNNLVALDEKIIALGSTIQAALSLIQALGGGYDTCDIEG
jgi:NodT family efflux transporter outer membrane factor (OMF) lipoprotein